MYLINLTVQAEKSFIQDSDISWWKQTTSLETPVKVYIAYIAALHTLHHILFK